MNTQHTRGTSMAWLLKREFWEHKGAMLWTPAVVAALLVVVLGVALAWAVSAQHGPMQITVYGPASTQQVVLDQLPPQTQEAMGQIAATSYFASAAPLLGILPTIVFFYCLGALYDERRDRSILFWKSLPVSDGMTVISKALTAMVVAPLVSLAVGTVYSLLLLLIACTVLMLNGVFLFGAILSQSDFYLAPLRMLALLPVYIVWALPSVGWLLLVSSWARTKPFLWALGVPLVTLLLVKSLSVALDKFAGTELLILPYVKDAVVHVLGGVIPGGVWFSTVPSGLQGAEHGPDLGRVFAHSWRTLAAPAPWIGAEHGPDLGRVFAHSWRTLAAPAPWIGALLGAAMLAAATRLRRWRDEG